METKKFEWVPFFKELAIQLLNFETKQLELVDILKKIGIEKGLNDQDPEGVIIPMNEIDPFTFFSLITKYGSDSKKIELFRKLKEFIKIDIEVPESYAGVPISNAQSAWFFRYKFDRLENDIKNLWRIYKESLNDSLSEESYSNALSIKLVGNAKLTQGLFWASPDKFFPINVQTSPYLKRLGLNDNPKNLKEYLDVCDSLIKRGIPLYEQSYLATEERNSQDSQPSSLLSVENENSSLELPDLSRLFVDLQDRANRIESYNVDQEISFDFQEIIRDAAKDTHEISFSKYCTKLIIKDTQNRIVVPNIAFFMAIEAVQMYKGISDYNDTFISIYRKLKEDKLITSIKAENFYQDLIKPENELKEHFDRATEDILKDQGRFSDQNIERFRKFVYQKSWSSNGTAEGKSPGRSDPHRSPILTAFGVSQSNQGFIFELIVILQKSRESLSKFSLLSNEVVNPSGTVSKNLIVYGAPGTGKSFYINNLLKDTSTLRTVFHSETQNSDFVGTLKPITKQVDGTTRISYEFVAGPFIQAFMMAIKNRDKKINLIIEEINRANAAAVFGEIFQLLDRNSFGRSEYEIHADEILSQYLKLNLDSSFDGLIYIPSNLYIFATMNSSDQGVYPLDSAFKRRWSFKYMPIDFQDCPYGTIEIDNRLITWSIFARSLNEVLSTEYPNLDEDRLIGPWFLNNDEVNFNFSKAIESKLFTYLWNDVLRHQQRDKIFNMQNITTFGDLVKTYRGQLIGNRSYIFSDLVLQAFDKNLAETIPTVDITTHDDADE